MKIFTILVIFQIFVTTLLASNSALLFSGNCITCHEINKTISAPSIVEVKNEYLRAFPYKNDFIKAMSTWVVKPNGETSIMLGAINKFNLMPNLGYDLNTLREITRYIYETDFND